MKRTSLLTIETYFRDLGVSEGDVLLIHADLMVFGVIEGNAKEFVPLLQDIVGECGTLVIPSFTFSFPNDFDIKKTPSTTGALSRLFAKEESVKRLPDGMTSYYMIGRDAERFINNWSRSHSSYGENSIPQQICQRFGKVLQLGTDILSLIHSLEENIGVPYREIKRFSGKIVDGNRIYDSYTDFYARIRDVKKVIPDPIRTSFYKGLDNSIQIEGKELRLFDAGAFMKHATPILKDNPTILIKPSGSKNESKVD